ncbi:uncharacterized protein EV420DRAFT_1489337, partial [Desarmillaria tabescens]
MSTAGLRLRTTTLRVRMVKTGSLGAVVDAGRLCTTTAHLHLPRLMPTRLRSYLLCSTTPTCRPIMIVNSGGCDETRVDMRVMRARMGMGMGRGGWCMLVELSGSPSIPPPPPAPAPAPTVVQAKALWAYNLDASDPDDLSFAAGDIIAIVEETNADWWLGEHNGCRALFPANYVEKITAPAPAARTLPPVYIPPTGGRSVPPAPAATQKKEYKPFMAAHSGSNVPPPPGAGTNSVGLQQDPGQDGKKSKFGKYGNTMAHSAAGGVGFGAGAAIG